MERVIQTISDNQLNGRDVVDMDVLFDGRIQRNESRHITDYQDANEKTILEQRYWEYDQAGRDLTLKYAIDNNTPFVMYSKKLQRTWAVG
ncbi:MAG: hypothetical protein U5Q03_18155 [Bacteroidota bacterium]|nr:hypothetical protein [Bacteroidota bacterium]